VQCDRNSVNILEISLFSLGGLLALAILVLCTLIYIRWARRYAANLFPPTESQSCPLSLLHAFVSSSISSISTHVLLIGHTFKGPRGHRNNDIQLKPSIPRRLVRLYQTLQCSLPKGYDSHPSRLYPKQPKLVLETLPGELTGKLLGTEDYCRVFPTLNILPPFLVGSLRAASSQVLAVSLFIVRGTLRKSLPIQ
jgi:hypothetical protein